MKNKSIDVSKLANEIFNEIENRSVKEFDELLETVKEAEGDTHKQAILFNGILEISKKHSERFTVNLIQKVIDELQGSNER